MTWIKDGTDTAPVFGANGIGMREISRDLIATISGIPEGADDNKTKAMAGARSQSTPCSPAWVSVSPLHHRRLHQRYTPGFNDLGDKAVFSRHRFLKFPKAKKQISFLLFDEYDQFRLFSGHLNIKDMKSFLIRKFNVSECFIAITFECFEKKRVIIIE